MDDNDYPVDMAQTFILCAVAFVTFPIIGGGFLPLWASASLCIMSPACFVMAMIFSSIAMIPEIKRQSKGFIPAIWDLSKLPLSSIIEKDGQMFLRADRPGVVWRLDPIYIPLEDKIWASSLGKPMKSVDEAVVSFHDFNCVYNGKKIPQIIKMDDHTYNLKSRACFTEKQGRLEAKQIFFRGFIYEPVEY